MTNLGRVASIRMGYPFRSRLEHNVMGAIAVVQMKDIDDASLLHVEDAVRVDLADVKEHHLIRQGDLVFRSRGRTNSVALVSADIGPAVLAAPMLLIRPVKVLPAYLLWYINLPAIQAALAAQAEGTSVRMISKAALEALEMPVPSQRTQQMIVEVISLGHDRARLAGANCASKEASRGWGLDAVREENVASEKTNARVSVMPKPMPGRGNYPDQQILRKQR